MGPAELSRDSSGARYFFRARSIAGRAGQVRGVQAEVILTNSDLAMVATGPANPPPPPACRATI